MLNLDALHKGFKKVLRAKGAAGVDGQSLSDYAVERDNNLTQLQHELQTRQYRPLAVKRVEIPKAGGGVRLLGIPAVRDRIVQYGQNGLVKDYMSRIRGPYVRFCERDEAVTPHPTRLI
jgi:hypothetical protein